jgi:hypothetical protein
MASTPMVVGKKNHPNEHDIRDYVKQIEKALSETNEQEFVIFDFGKITHISQKSLQLLAICATENSYRVRFIGMSESIDKRLQIAKGHIIMLAIGELEEKVKVFS